MPESFKAYTELVCRQLRWKKARPVIERELGAHLCDQRDALIKSGLDEDDATRESIRQMGDAVAVGTALDRVHRPKPAWTLIALTALLALLGMSIRLFLTYDSDAPLKPLLNLAALLLGTGCMLGAYFLDFTIIGKRPLVFYIGAVLAVVLSCLIPGQRMISGQYYYVQYVLLLFPLAFAALLYRLRGRKYAGLILAFLGAALLSLGCLLVPSFAGLAITVPAALALLCAAAAGDWFSIGRAKSFLFIGAMTLAAAVLLLLTIPADSWLAEHVSAAFNPWSDRVRSGYLGVVVRELTGGARFIGRGITGEYSADASLLFGRGTDFLLTWLIHNVGWIAFLIVLAVFAAFLICGFRLCFKQQNTLGRLVSLAVMLTLTLQTFFYVAANLGLVLIHTTSLPLVSYGNMATVVNMALIGVMLSAFRTGALVKDGAPGLRTAARRLFWKNGELTISFRRHSAS
jgi:cell division protein FtsW (lipid II flippase)